jgi:hypothetical protein
VRIGLREMCVFVFRWSFPLSCGEATEDEVSGCLDDGQSPTLLIAAGMEVLCLPAMSVGIINSLEPSLGILVPNKLHDHLPMGRGPKGLRVFEIFFGIFHYWYRFNCHLFQGISKIFLSLGKL